MEKEAAVYFFLMKMLMTRPTTDKPTRMRNVVSKLPVKTLIFPARVAAKDAMIR
jgi:hypothetical protein